MKKTDLYSMFEFLNRQEKLDLPINPGSFLTYIFKQRIIPL